MHKDYTSGWEGLQAPGIRGGIEVTFQHRWGATGRSRLKSSCTPREKLEPETRTGSEASLDTLTSDLGRKERKGKEREGGEGGEGGKGRERKEESSTSVFM